MGSLSNGLALNETGESLGVEHVVHDVTAESRISQRNRGHLRHLNLGLGAAMTFAAVLSVYSLAYYLSLGPQVLIRLRPEFVQGVTYPAILACALGIGWYASYLAVGGKRTRAWSALAWGCFGLLNFYSLWSSRAIMELLSPFLAQPYLYSLQSYGFGFGIFGNLPVDLISVFLVLAICLAVYFSHRPAPPAARILKVVQLGSLSVIPIPVYVLLFDTSEFNLHVTSLQEHYGLLQWFTNSDLLVLASGAFIASTLLLVGKLIFSRNPSETIFGSHNKPGDQGA